MQTGFPRPQFSAIAALALALVCCATAWAMPPYQDELFAQYPRAASSLSQCVACHDDASTFSLNVAAAPTPATASSPGSSLAWGPWQWLCLLQFLARLHDR
jgi:cytochrome c553